MVHNTYHIARALIAFANKDYSKINEILLIGGTTRVQYVHLTFDPQHHNSYLAITNSDFVRGVYTVANHNVAIVSACCKAI